MWSSKFWNGLISRLSTRFHFLSAFHPQANGRRKRTNKTIRQILRTFTAKKQGKWLDALPSVEFAINLAVNASTGLLPLDLLLMCQPTLFDAIDSTDTKNPPALTKWLTICKKTWATAWDELWSSCLKQAI
jgi:hypothetical protein